MSFFTVIESWENRNWFLVYRVAVHVRNRLRRGLKLNYLIFRLVFFVGYVLLSRSFYLANALLGFTGLREMKIQVGPEHPSVLISESHWHLKERTGPNVFLR